MNLSALDGESHGLSKSGSLWAIIYWYQKEGVAIHINAFNFPVWGMLEKSP